MSLTFSVYPGDLSSIGTQVVRALAGLGEPIEISDKLVMFGPFPMYIGDPKQYARGATRRAVVQTGWRGLISSGDRALANICLPCIDRKESSIHVRGQESAKALQHALEIGIEWIEKSNVSAELRFISFPSLFITAVWLHGLQPRFIPTRMDTQRVRELRLLTRTELIRSVARIQRERRRRAERT